jgi:PAS domain S-box-containing protein
VNKEILRVLILEDNPADADLIQFELEEAGIAFTAKVVITEKDFIKELQEFPPDIILSDYDLHKYTGALALAEAKKQCPDVPFVLVTGAVSEDRAIEILTSGAKDYVMKNRLNRLAPAVRRALAEAEEHRARKAAEEELREAHKDLEAEVRKRTAALEAEIVQRKRIEEALQKSERRERERAEELTTLLNAAPTPIFIAHDPDCIHLTGNRAADNLLRNPSGAEASLSAPDQIKPRHFKAVKDGRELNLDELPAQRAARGIPVQDFEFSLVFDDGSVRHVLGYGTPLNDEQGQPRGAVHVLIDITERKNAEMTLQQSKDRLAMALRASDAGIWHWEITTGHIEWSEELFRLFELDPRKTEASFDAWRSVIHPDDSETAAAQIEQALETKTTLNSEYRIVRPDKQIAWINALGEGQYDEQGRPIRMTGICLNITGRKQSEDELRRNEATLQGILNASKESIWLFSVEGTMLMGNQTALLRFEKPAEEIIGKHFNDILSPELAGLRLKNLKQTVTSKKPVEFEDERSGIIFRHSFYPVIDNNGNVSCVASFSRDITESKQTEERVAKLTRLYAALSRVNEAIVKVNDENSLYNEVCRIISEESNFPLVWIGQAEGKRVVPSAWYGSASDYLKEIKVETQGRLGHGPTGTCIRENRSVINDEFATNPTTSPWRNAALHFGFHSSAAFPLHRQGKAIASLTLYSCTPGAFDAEQVRLLESLSADISYALDALDQDRQRIMAEEALRSERDFISAVLDTASALVIVLDKQGKITRFNRECENITGYTAAQAKGRIFWEFLIPPEELAGVKTTWKSLTAGAFPNTFENHWLAKDGSQRLIAWSNSAIVGKDGDVRYIIGTGIDITERRWIEETLRESEERFKAIASNTPDHILIQDRELRYSFVINPQMGLTETDMIGKTDYDFLKKEDADKLTAIKQRVLDTGDPIQLESPLVDAKGGVHYFEGEFIPTFDGTNRVSGIIGYFRNITKRKEMEEALLRAKQEWERTFDAVPDLIAILDNQHKIMRTNKAMAQRLGLTPEQCIGKVCHKVVHGTECPPALCPHVLTLVDGEEHSSEVHEDCLGGDFLVSTTPLTDEQGHHIGSVHVARDITKRKKNENVLKERTEQLEATNKELESFSYSVSHDLRAPLRAIDGYSKMILKRLGDKFDEETKRQFNQIRNSTKDMGQLIDDLLALSKLGRQELKIKDLDMLQLIEETWCELQNADPDRQVTLKMKDIPQGWGDRSLLKQVWVNLLSNALKFSRMRKKALIEVGGNEKENEIVYYVKDNGIGFDMMCHDKIFGVFQRLHSASEYEGSGIGLAIVQRIIHHHGGRIWAEGTVDKGAVFYFALPGKE